jgi:hypothetical protein
MDQPFGLSRPVFKDQDVHFTQKVSYQKNRALQPIRLMTVLQKEQARPLSEKPGRLTLIFSFQMLL